jgi:hypothetical protein
MNKNLIFIILLICIIIVVFKHSCKEEFKPFFTHNNSEKKKKLPPGNWSNSCQLLDLRYPLIWAECKNKKGIYKMASKDLSRCLSKNLSNIDGELHCDNN